MSAMTAPADGTMVRPAIPSDLNYIFATVLRDMRDTDGSVLEDDLWYTAHRTYLERVLLDPTVEVHVLAAEDDHTEILGYVVARPNKELIWCHIRKGPLRGHGLAKRLLTVAQVLSAPAAWTTPQGRSRLRNQWRGRRLRPHARSSAATR